MTKHRPENDSLRDYILDQLAGIDGIACRAMFGGFGLYRGTVFFGILHRGRLFLKTDAESRAAFEARGMECFRPSARQRLTQYMEVPPDIIDSADELREWTLQSIAVARRS